MNRVLFLIEDGSYQFDNRVRREINTLKTAGIEAIVICPSNSSDEPTHYEEDGVHIYQYNVDTQGAGIKAHLREYALSLIHQTFLAGKIYWIHRFSVVHVGNHSDLFWLVALPYKIMGKRFIYDQHDPTPELFNIRFGKRVPWLGRIVRVFEKASFILADHVISTNETCRKLALNRGGKRPDQVTVVRNGPRLSDFPEVAPDPKVRALGRTVVGYLGHMNLQDNVEDFLEIARIIRLDWRRDDIGFVMVGFATNWHRLKDLRDELGLTDAIYMPGRLPWKDVLSIMEATDICVQPDLPNEYSNIVTMNKLMEYMALSKAVVAFDLVETRVSGGEAVVYCSEFSPDSMAAEVVALSDDKERCRALGVRGKNRIEETLGWHHQAQALLSVYERFFPGLTETTEAR